ncbi:unnamed protein product [Arctogadus glacialis]
MFTETQDILAVSLRKVSGIRRYMESTLWSQNTGVTRQRLYIPPALNYPPDQRLYIPPALNYTPGYRQC